jgi:hypothetical protein
MGFDPISALITVASFIYQYDQQQDIKKRQKAQAAAAKDRAATREIRLTGSNQPIPNIYGYSRVDPIDVYTSVASSFNSVAATADEDVLGNLGSFSGSKNETLIMQRVLGNSPIEELVFADINDEAYDGDDYLDWVKLYINKNGGSINGSATLDRDGSATFEDVTYSTEYFRMNRDEPQFGGKPYTAYYVKGKKIRTFSAGSLQATKVFSNNSIEVLVDYLLDDIIGPGLTESALDISSFDAAATISNQIIKSGVTTQGKVHTGTASRDIKRHEFNGQIFPDVDHITNIGTILETVPGAVLFRDVHGKIKLSVPDSTVTAADASEGTISDAELTSDIRYSQSDVEGRYNKVVISYANAAKDFASDTYENINTTYLTDDLNVPLELNHTMAGVCNYYSAIGISSAMMNESRLAGFRFETTHECLNYEPGDVVRLNSSRNNFDRYVRINSIQMNLDYTLDVIAIEYDPSIYVYNSAAIENVHNQTVIDFTVEPPTNVAASIISTKNSLYNIVEITFTDADDAIVHEYEVEVGVDLGSGIEWTPIGTVHYGIGKILHQPTFLTTYQYRIRSKTRLGRFSSWLTSNNAIVTSNALISNINFNIPTPNLIVKRDNTTGNTDPVSPATDITLYLFNTEANYDSVGDLSSKSWRITSPLTGDLTNPSQGSYAITFVGNVATLTITLDQTTITPYAQDFIAIDFAINGTEEELAITDPDIINITKNIYLLELVDGAQGPQGDPGTDGADGDRGPGWWRTTEAVDQATLDAYSSSTVNSKFEAATGLTAVIDDIFIISGTAPAVKAWRFNGVTWDVQVQFIDGNLLVDGTVTAQAINVTDLSSINANIGTITAGVLKSDDNLFVIDLDNKSIYIS